MKGILINPENNTITEVDHDGNYKNIYLIIDTDCFDIQRLEPKQGNDNGIYVDDNGLNGEVKFGFQYGENQPIAGKGFILGCNRKGETISTNLTVEEVRTNVKIFTSYMSFRMGALAWSKKYEQD